jgi:hypothetical protein
MTEMVERSVVRDRPGEGGATQGEINKVARQAVGDALDGCARMLGALDGFDDAAEGDIAPYLLHLNFEDTGVVDGAGENPRAGKLFDWKGFAGDGGLIHEGVPGADQAIRWNVSLRDEQPRYRPGGFLRGCEISLRCRCGSRPPEAACPGGLDCAAAPAYHEAFQNLRD